MTATSQRKKVRRGSTPAVSVSSFLVSGCLRRCPALSGPRGLDQMQHAREQRASLGGAPDMDDAAALKLVGEYIGDHLEHLVVEGTERTVDEYPGWIRQQDAGDGQAELLVLIQFSIPAVGGIEQRREPFETQPIQDAVESSLGETLVLPVIGEDSPQSCAVHVGRAATQVKYLFARRPRDVPAAPGPQPRQRPEK